MNFKNTLVAFALLIGSTAGAQSGYASFNVGYALPFGESVIGTSVVNTTQSNIYGSFGNGLQFNLRVGHWFTDHFAFELGANAYHGIPTIGSSTKVDGLVDLTTKFEAIQIRTTPALVIASGHEGFNMYARFGMPMVVGGRTEIHTEGTQGGLDIMSEGVAKGDFSVGFLGAFGITYDVSDRFSLFGEIEGVGLSIKGNTVTTTSYSVDGADQLGNLSTYDKEIKFVDELTPTSNNADVNPDFNSDLPKEQLAAKVPYSSIGLNIGIKFNFSRN